jgi:hypothetical protein
MDKATDLKRQGIISVVPSQLDPREQTITQSRRLNSVHVSDQLSYIAVEAGGIAIQAAAHTIIMSKLFKRALDDLVPWRIDIKDIEFANQLVLLIPDITQAWCETNSPSDTGHCGCPLDVFPS